MGGKRGKKEGKNVDLGHVVTVVHLDETVVRENTVVAEVHTGERVSERERERKRREEGSQAEKKKRKKYGRC